MLFREYGMEENPIGYGYVIEKGATKWYRRYCLVMSIVLIVVFVVALAVVSIALKALVS